ncbi:hypothetical protein PVK06_005090 [Gossypium arboreum]|uniref:Uncharacterized protein n=1 Tax=Gossypium arboreum TaxID=29729 RepID=A0ABR0QTX3_GOSAR|nr:hypothetical protein PVK06_005090 [Gossypium arboreum]
MQDQQVQEGATSQQEKGALYEDSPQPPRMDIPALMAHPSPRTLTLLNTINGLYLRGDAQFDVLKTDINDRYNLLDEHILDHASQFPPPPNT